MKAIEFVQSNVNPCVWYREEMVLLFYVDDCLMFSPSKEKLTIDMPISRKLSR